MKAGTSKKSSAVRHAAVIGMGMMGSSLALALRGKGVEVTAWDKLPKAAAKFKAKGIKSAKTAEEAVSDADFVVLCAPVGDIARFLEKHAADFKKSAVVTDVGSVKTGVVAAADKAFQKRGVSFVGSHPMAGSHRGGPEGADAGLFKKAVVFVTPGKTSGAKAVGLVKKFWKDLGAGPMEIGPVEHDELVACSSHLPHMLSAALTLGCLGCDDAELARKRALACSSGFRDVSRIAASPPEMWLQIIESNRGNLLKALADFEKVLAELKRLVRTGRTAPLGDMLARASRLRKDWEKGQSKRDDAPPRG